MTFPSYTAESCSAGMDLIARGKRVITADGERAAAIHIRGGLIARVADYYDVPAGCPVYEAGDSVVMPGLVDTHVHINEPGRTEWEGFTTATRAAAAGGITTLIEMPLNSIPATISLKAFEEKVRATEGKLWVDTGFWGGLVPGNTGELQALWEAGSFGFKCFLVDSGVPEFSRVSEIDLRRSLPALAQIGAPLLVHAELPGPIENAANQRSADADGRSYNAWLKSRPRDAENDAIGLLLKLGREYGVHIHVVHLSSSDALPSIRQAKRYGKGVSVETCAHYLTFSAEEIGDGATQFKCAPPIRERENREKLWAALDDGTIDLIATDHSPCPPAMKCLEEGDFMKAWGGIASLQLNLPAMWTEARARGYALTHLVKWMCSGPASLAGLEGKKGAISAGLDADLVIWNPNARFRVDPAHLHHRHKLTPYAGRDLAGVVESTFLRGRRIFGRGKFEDTPSGNVLFRGTQ